MLDAFIIEEIQRRERDRRIQPHVESPSRRPPAAPAPADDADRPDAEGDAGDEPAPAPRGRWIIDRNDDEDDRGVVTFDM